MYVIKKSLLLVVLPIAVAVAVIGYIVSLEAGVKNAALLVAVGIVIIVYIVRKPAWLIVERVLTSDYGQTPLLGISPAEGEKYASLVEALRKADEAYLANQKTPSGTLSRISKSEANKILGFLRSQNLDPSPSKRFYVEYDGRAYHAILQFQYERPKLPD